MGVASVYHPKWLAIFLLLVFCVAGSGYAASGLNLFLDIPFGIDSDEYVRKFADLNLVMERLSKYKVVMGDKTEFRIWGYPVDYANASFDNNRLTFIEVGLQSVNAGGDHDQYIDAFEDLSNRLNDNFGKFDYRIMTLNGKGYTFPYNTDSRKIDFDKVASVTSGQSAFSVSLYWKNVSLVMSRVDGEYLKPVMRFQNSKYTFAIETPGIYNG